MIRFEAVRKIYEGRTALEPLDLEIAQGEFLVLLGTSGCGKTTTLRLINGLIAPSEGRVLVDGQDVALANKERLRRGIGYVIQNAGLFPHWRARDNIAAVPRLLGWDETRIETRVDELVTLLRLDPALLDMYPHHLSGGQQQRIGVARALAADPAILLMDEPFGALDPVTRGELQRELKDIHSRTGKTIVFVTHDVDEALALATRIAVMSEGRMVALGTPRDILRDETPFVRSFVGGADTGLRLLAVEKAGDHLRPWDGAPDHHAGEPITAATSLRDALSVMMDKGVDRLAVSDGQAQIGTLHLSDLVVK